MVFGGQFRCTASTMIRIVCTCVYIYRAESGEPAAVQSVQGGGRRRHLLLRLPATLTHLPLPQVPTPGFFSKARKKDTFGLYSLIRKNTFRYQTCTLSARYGTCTLSGHIFSHLALLNFLFKFLLLFILSGILLKSLHNSLFSFCLLP